MKNVIGLIGYLYDYVSYLRNLQDKAKDIEAQNQIESATASYWNGKWERSPIKFQTNGKFYRDVRAFLPYRSWILQKCALDNRFHLGTDDEKILKILKYVKNKIVYKSDEGADDDWSEPEITLQRGLADCEDGSLLIKSLSLFADIPDYKVKLVGGWAVKEDTKEEVGHLYPIYLRESDNQWVVIDWTFYPNELEIKGRIPHKLDTHYGEIWWTFNQRFTFSPKEVEIRKGDFKK